MTYVSYPENTLWRRKVDGSERLQLTYAPEIVVAPHWSPDGKHISFTGFEVGKLWTVYIVSADGGPPEVALQEDRSQLGGAWSPDSSSVMVGYIIGREKHGNLKLVNLATKKPSDVAGSDDLWIPTWSLDGRYVVAQTPDVKQAKLFDSKSGQWTSLIDGIATNVLFSHDSKFVFYEDTNALVHRVTMATRKVETVMNFKELPAPACPTGPPGWGWRPTIRSSPCGTSARRRSTLWIGSGSGTEPGAPACRLASPQGCGHFKRFRAQECAPRTPVHLGKMRAVG